MSENFTNTFFGSLAEFIVDSVIGSVGVGSGTKELSQTDDRLDNELYHTSVESSNVDVYTTSTAGEIKASISVAGGTEVDPGDKITEFGLFDNDGDLIYRTVRESVEISDGERITFTFSISVVNDL